MAEDELEDLLAKARARPPRVPDALMARVLDDAVALQPAVARGWRFWLQALGGLPALGGLVTATCVGFWLGAAPPAGVDDLAIQVLGGQGAAATALSAELDGFGWDMDEG